MGLKSEQPIRAPGIVRGNLALEKFSKDVQSAFGALIGRGSPDPHNRYHGSPYSPLTPHFLREESGQWKVQWRPGYVYQVYPHTSGTGPLTEFEIYIGATALSAAEAPDLDVALGNFVYLHFETDSKGAIKELDSPGGRYAEIVALASAQDSTFHVLPDGDGSGTTDGDYYLHLATIETLDGQALMSRSGFRGNFFWKSGWNALENVGSGEKIYKEYDIAGDNKQLRTLIERASSHQINLSQVGDDEIRVEGNNRDGTLAFKDCSGATLYTLSWLDGLVTNTGDATITIPPCAYNSTAEIYFAHTEFSDMFTFSAVQKAAISSFFDATDTAEITSKITGLHFMGTNALVGLRNAIDPGTVHATWLYTPPTFETGYVFIDGSAGSFNQTPTELGMSATSAGGFVTITDAPRTNMAMMNSYNSSTSNFQIKQNNGELMIRNAFSSNAIGTSEEQNGVFVATRNAGAVTCVNYTGYAGSATTTHSRSGGTVATNNVALFDGTCEFNISIMGQTAGLTQAEAETLAALLYTCGVAVGHTALEST